MSEETPEVNAMEFTLTARKTKPKRKYRKGSKYDPMIDGIIEALKTEELLEVKTDKDPNYLRTQLDKRIVARELKGINISVTNNKVYAERA